MLNTLHTLLRGSAARSEEQTEGHFAIEVIDQKIREAHQSLQSSKHALAALIQTERKERRQIAVIEERISALSSQTKEALAAGKNELAKQAAHSIASMENELATRTETADRISARIVRLRQSLETGNRRIIDLKQGALSAKAVRREHRAQARLNSTLAGYSSIEEAETLIAKVIGSDDPLEQSEILSEIDQSLDHSGISEKLADNGFGSTGRITAQDVIERLAAQ